MLFNLNFKRVIPAVLCCLIIPISIVYPPGVVADDADTSEKIELSVNYLGASSYDKYQQNFTPVNLRPFVNRSFIDEVAGDHKGGWSDQGSNDFRTFDARGVVKFLGIPFDIIEPNDNDDQSVIVLRGQDDPGVENSVEVELGNVTASGLYFLHTSAWVGDAVSGTYTINYSDGTSAYIELLNAVHIFDAWGTGNSKYCRLAWSGPSAATSAISLGLFALNNPHPEKPIKSLTLSTAGTGPYVMVLAITLTDTAPTLPVYDQKDIILNPSVHSWIEYKPGDEKTLKGSVLDMSKYLDAPAGKHGKLRVDGEKFVFEDGTQIKFWGTNLVGNSCFPEREIAERLSESIAQCGYNIVRFTEFDGKNGIFNGDGMTPNEEKLDKFAYLISCLEKKGIYVYLTLNSLREVNDGVKSLDNNDVAPGFKLKGFFDTELVKVQKNFIKQLLSYVNPYTDKRIGDSPSLVMIEFADSNTMFEYTSGYSDFSIRSKEYRDELKILFNNYLRKKYGDTNTLRKKWQGEYDLAPYENLEDLSVELKSVWRDFFYSANRICDIQMFFAHIQYDYYLELQNTLKEIQVDVLSTCNSNVVGNIDTADSYVNSKTDFVSRRASWPVPSAKRSQSLSDPMVLEHYCSVISDEYGGIFGELAKNRFLGTPYVVSAWSVLETNPYMAEMPLIMAAVSAKQGWNSIQYSFVTDNFNFEGDKIEDFYSSYNHPVRMAMMPVSATLFYTMDEEKTINKIWYTEDEIHSFDNLYEYEKKELLARDFVAKVQGSKKIYFYNPFVKINNYDLLGNKSGIEISNKAINSNRTAKSNHEVISNNNFRWDIKRGVFMVENDFVQAASGILTQPCNLKNLYFESRNLYVDNAMLGITVSLISSDGDAISRSGKMLLTTVARAVNSRFQNSFAKEDTIDKAPINTGLISDAGREPVMVEPVCGRFILKIQGEYDVYALSNSGERTNKIAAFKTNEGYLTFDISNATASQQYEIVRK